MCAASTIRRNTFDASSSSEISGPDPCDDTSQIQKKSVGKGLLASCVSTYPKSLDSETVRMGDPICDRYCGRLYKNGAAIALADGCNWGQLPYTAARKATDAFMEFLKEKSGNATNTRKAASYLLAALSKANNAITEGREAGQPCGQTTLAGGLLLPLRHTSSPASPNVPNFNPSSVSSAPSISASPEFTSMDLKKLNNNYGGTPSITIQNNNNNNNNNYDNNLSTTPPYSQASTGLTTLSTPSTLSFLNDPVSSKAERKKLIRENDFTMLSAGYNFSASAAYSTSPSSGNNGSGGGPGVLRTSSSSWGYDSDELPKSPSKAKTLSPHILSRSHSMSNGSAANQFIFVCVSLGDCKAFHFSQSKQEFKDITQGNRQNLTDARDPGGRLGPYINEGPDLRNLCIYSQVCDPGDLIFLVSDGIHDNLDLQQLGIDANIICPEAQTWEEAETQDPLAVEEIKSAFLHAWLHEVFLKREGRVPAPTEILEAMYLEARRKENLLDPKIDGEKRKLTPEQICDVLIRHSINVTRSSRDFMETNTKRLPTDYKKYPGKLDHSTCICLKVGSFAS
eukprot:TRINITY_DN3396_c0_g1_i1.p1 TRINITY_DN3396_c0_g1~~TRINITY_DN3396_c0_g1_i1.p1  ORF type:complete len:567 (-),score=176.41 TRINITY_DN3396_c0_g1_i1:303-2003(-)